MAVETDPVIEVQQSILNGKPYYKLVLSRLNFNHLCAGCPDIDRLIGHSASGVMFYVFENPLGDMPKSFRPLPNRDGYFGSVGAPVPRIPFGVTREQFDELSRQATQNLELAINSSGPIPIEEETVFGVLNFGYVKIRVAKEK